MPDTNNKRLIEVAFPLKQVSLDSVHEKNVRHGHISTLHIWPARRPLAACRAALIATLLPDPGDEEERREILRRMAGKVVEENGKETTEGGILHWGREDREDLDWFREKIREAYDGRAPKVLDPFAGGGAIPLEAMRLGCEATAIDINPVAWFILKCTLEYPQKLAGQTRPLPDFALQDPEFMDDYLKDLGYTKAKRRDTLRNLGLKDGNPLSKKQIMFDGMGEIPEADLSWHVRAWGRWVLEKARRELAEFYPTYASFEAPDEDAGPICDGKLKRVPLNEDGTPDIDALNAEYEEAYLADETNPRWVAKPTVAYLWARAVKCKGCRNTLPLLKTQWLCKKKGKRVRLTLTTEDVESTADERGDLYSLPGISLSVDEAQDGEIFDSDGTMSRSGAQCPHCGAIMKMGDLRAEGKAGRLGEVMTAVVVDGRNGKEYRAPTDHEREMAVQSADKVDEVFADIPFGVPDEPLPQGGGSGAGRAFSIPKYGFETWGDLFTPRQLMALGSFVRAVRSLRQTLKGGPWCEAISFYLASSVDRLANQGSTGAMWNTGGEKIEQTFARFALPLHWDFPETNVLSELTGGYQSAIGWIGRVVKHSIEACAACPKAAVSKASAKKLRERDIDAVLTDPPYYDAIPYSDLMDFFYVWIRRCLSGLSTDVDDVLEAPLSPKWDHEENDGEIIEDESRFEGDKQRARTAYEEGMSEAFSSCRESLTDEGRMGLVFANKQPEAWETLASALIRSGFVVDASWPIETERRGGMRNYGRASLSSSVWLICRKRAKAARPGWDNRVLSEMRQTMTEKLRDFWDAGIRGPDFVWAATGPALEAYSKHPVVKKADQPGEVMSVGEFLQHVRRFVVDFQVGRVLSGDGEVEQVGELDDPTTYYLLHRNDFGGESAPAGAVILYALSCGVSDSDLSGKYDIISKSGSKYRLKPWNKRTGKNLGQKSPGNGAVPMVDMVHRLMHLWRAGDVREVDDYVDERGLRRNELFGRVLQAIIELSGAGSEERSLLESISNHVKKERTTTRERPGKAQSDFGWKESD